MTISADTNVLLRFTVRDDVAQARAAKDALKGASLVVVTLPSLCEFVWVLRSVYGLSKAEAASLVTTILETKGIAVDRSSVEAGLAALNAGADFADGVIAYQGRQLGGETFVSFDRKAVAAMEKQGFAARLLG